MCLQTGATAVGWTQLLVRLPGVDQKYCLYDLSALRGTRQKRFISSAQCFCLCMLRLGAEGGKSARP